MGSTPDPWFDPDDSVLDHDDDNLDPGAAAKDAGVPEVADDATTHGMTERDDATETPLDERLAAEEPDIGDDR